MSRSYIPLGAVIIAIIIPAAARAEDAVEALKHTLKDSNWAQVPKDAARLKSIAELRRGYFLIEWPSTLEDADAWKLVDKAHKEVGDRLAAAIRANALAPESDPLAAVDRKIAACMLIAEIADNEQPDQRNPAGTGKYASRFTKFLIGDKEQKGLIHDEDVRVRQVAVRALGKITPLPGEAMPVLRAILKGSDTGPRMHAAYALTDLVRNAPFLSRKDEMTTINQAVAEAVSVFGAAGENELVRGYCMQTVLTSAKIFTDYHWTTRFEKDEPGPIQFENGKLVPSLQELLKSYRTAMPRLLDSLESDPSARIKLASFETINQIITSRYKLCERMQAENGVKKLTRTELLKKFAAPDPIDALLDGRWTVLPAVLKHDEDIRLKRGVMSLLENVAEDFDASVEAKIQEKKITPETLKKFVKAITPALSDPDRYVRWTAARTLRYISPEYFDEEVVLALGQMLIDPGERDPDLGAAAATTLEVIAAAPYATRAIRYLRSAIADPSMDSGNRIAAMKALVAIGGKTANEAFPDLTAAVGDSDMSVRREACLTMGQLGQPATMDAYVAALNALKTALRDEDSQLRTNASEAILSLRRPR